MREKGSRNLHLMLVLIYVVFQTCTAEEVNTLHNIQLKMEQMDRKIDTLQNREAFLSELSDRQQNTILELQRSVAKQQHTINQHQTTIRLQKEAIRHHDNLLSATQQQKQQQTDDLSAVRSETRKTYRESNKVMKKHESIVINQYNQSKLTSMVVTPENTTKQRRSARNPLYGETHQKRSALSYEGPIAFTTTLTKTTDNIGDNQNIHFDNIILNLGNGYNGQDGIFTVPQSGLYIFSASLLFDNKNSVYANAFITHNGKNIAGLHAHDNVVNSWDHSSQSIILQADQGDEVWVRNVGLINTSVYGGSYSTFSGCLLF